MGPLQPGIVRSDDLLVLVYPASSYGVAEDDMRRSGAVEGMAGGATPSDISMANTLMASTRLQKTYTTVNVASALR